MYRRLSLLLLLAGALQSAWAVRVIEQPESAYELALGDVTLPAGITGAISFRACADCSPASLRVSAATRYLVNGRELALEELLRRVAQLKASDATWRDSLVTVYYDRASHRVNRIALLRPTPGPN